MTESLIVRRHLFFFFFSSNWIFACLFNTLKNPTTHLDQDVELVMLCLCDSRLFDQTLEAYVFVCSAPFCSVHLPLSSIQTTRIHSSGSKMRLRRCFELFRDVSTMRLRVMQCVSWMPQVLSHFYLVETILNTFLFTYTCAPIIV